MEDLKQYLYEKNEHCINCRWEKQLKCVNFSSDFYNLDIEYSDTKNCKHYYPSDDMELFNSTDEETKSLFED